jgi:uncharacterized protein
MPLIKSAYLHPAHHPQGFFMNKNVTILAKNPFTDRVKTRLAKDIGRDAACGIYARLLYQTLFQLLTPFKPSTRLTLSLVSDRDRPFFAEAFPELEITIQSPGSIGEKMNHALKTAFDNGAQKAIVIGSDLPDMDWELLDLAFKKITRKSIVLGPARDGGYYLIGMQSPGIDVFQDIPWSTNHVLTNTLERIADHGYQPEFLPEFQDIDHEPNLREWQASLRN